MSLKRNERQAVTKIFSERYKAAAILSDFAEWLFTSILL